MSENNKNNEKILAFFLMKFKISPKDSLNIIEEWHNQNLDSNYLFLEACLRNNLVVMRDNQLVNLFEQRIMTLVNDMRGEDGIEIKDRRYNLLNYPQCFIGSEVVKWMEEKYLLSKSEAVNLGQELIDLNIIHHVTDDHKFKNDYLFYRFYIDE